METTHPEFIQPADQDVKVWRYIDLAKLIDILREKHLYLTRLDLLGDPHEGALTRKEAIQAKAMQSVLNWSGRQYDGSEPAIFRKRIYANCWRMDPHESEAMWKLYCPGNQGIALQTTYRKLAESSDEEHLKIGKIEYKDYDQEDFKGFRGFEVVMNKRIAFEHEKEVRIIAFIEKTDDGIYSNGIRISWDIKECIECIYVNPYADGWFKDVVENTLRAFDYQGMRVEWSKLKGDPFY